MYMYTYTYVTRCCSISAVEEGVGILDQILQSDNDPTNPESLVKEAAQGHTDIVKDIITRHPDQVCTPGNPVTIYR